jgi:formamidopyrimidine-DNA glycosylase
MPELPEVETVRRQLEPELVGKRIVSASVLDERLTRPEPPRSLERAVKGREVTAVARRGKYLLVGLEGGRTLAMHLRMTGNLLLRDSEHGETADLMKSERLGGPRLYESAPEPKHVRARFELDDGRTLVFTDVRRFGQAIVLDAGDKLDEFFATRLGVEPLSDELTSEKLLELAKDRKAPLKSFLLTQSRVAGIGNIYADEALWRARIHPLRPAGSLDGDEVARLRKAIRAALEMGIARQGATLRDYRDPEGRRGRMQDEFKVYGRAGEPCPRCGTPIEKTRVAGRGTWYCPECQERDPG